MQHLVKLASIVILTAAAAVGCASGSAPGTSASAEMKEGYRAARRGYWQEALMRFERANQLEPNQVRILNNVAVALEAVGRFEDARKVYEEARAIDPGDPRLKKNYRLADEFYQANIADQEKPAEEGDEGAGEGVPEQGSGSAKGGDDA